MCFYLYDMSRMGKTMEIESRSDVANDWVRRGHTRDWVWVSLGVRGDHENVPKLNYGGGCRTL